MQGSAILFFRGIQLRHFQIAIVGMSFILSSQLVWAEDFNEEYNEAYFTLTEMVIEELEVLPDEDLVPLPGQSFLPHSFLVPLKKQRRVLSRTVYDLRNESEFSEPEMEVLEDSQSALGGLDTVSGIVKVGEVIWGIVKDGEPDINAQTVSASALPAVAQENWTQVVGWSTQPVMKDFRVYYKNGFKKVVVDFNYRISYLFGGSYRGQGSYLADIKVVSPFAEAKWGFKLDAYAQVPSVVNVGTVENPVAGAYVDIVWSAGSKLRKFHQTKSYMVHAKGSLADLESR